MENDKKLTFTETFTSGLVEVEHNQSNPCIAISLEEKIKNGSTFMLKSKKDSMKSLISKYSTENLNRTESKSEDSCCENFKSENSSQESLNQNIIHITDSHKSSQNSNNHFYSDVMVNMIKKFSKAIESYFLDILFNCNETYEEYIVNNLKVIKSMQFFMLQSDYDAQYTSIQKVLHDNYAVDYDSPYLVVDLDETLIHSEPFHEENRNKYSVIAEISNQHVNLTSLEKNPELFGIFIRPFALDFLKFCKQHFKLILFTAADKSYAQAAVNACCMTDYFELILDRNSTISIKNFFLKDLAIFNLEQKLNCLLLDNNIYSFASSLNQGILITSYYNDPNDSELSDIINYLKENIIVDIPNMITINGEYYMYEELMNNLNMSVFDSENLIN